MTTKTPKRPEASAKPAASAGAAVVAPTAALPLSTLRTYFFSRIDYELRPNARERSAQTFDGATLSGTVQRVASAAERVLTVRIQLEDERAPYRYSLEVVGLVSEVPLLDDAKQADVHVIRCVAPVLLGALREQLYALTGRGPGFPTLLPLVGMKQLVECFNLQEWVEPKALAAHPLVKQKRAAKP